MKKKPKKKSPGEKIGAASLVLGTLLLFFHPPLAILPFGLFLLLCLIMPFLPCAGFFLPIICRTKAGVKNIALTFDDGPTPETTPILLELLAEHGLQATFFVIGEKACAYPELIKNILMQGHTIGNHSLRHDPLLMLRRARTLQADIHNTQKILQEFGIQPHIFRPPAGITNPHLEKILAREGLTAVNYSCRAFDRGNRNINNLAEKILTRLQPGDIIMLHDLPPQQKELLVDWRLELDYLFGELKRNYTTSELEDILQRPVMTTI